MVQQNVNLRISLLSNHIYKGDIHMKHPNLKSGDAPSVSKTSFESPYSCIATLTNNKVSNGANLFQQGYMERARPLPVEQLRREYENGRT